jgi:16S rRNA (guanine527-N7)-methyltransferase
MSYLPEQFTVSCAESLAQWQILPSKEQLAQLQALGELLFEWNSMVNLTRIKPEDYLSHHILDSCAVLAVHRIEEGASVTDIGTGAGFPGLPLAILNPLSSFTLIDSTAKKLHFINQVVSALGLKNVVTVHGRAEELGKQDSYGGRSDLVVARAVAALPTLLPWLFPFCKRGGYLLALKGPSAAEELAGVRKLPKGWSPPEVLPIANPGVPDQQRVIVRMRRGVGDEP